MSKVSKPSEVVLFKPYSGPAGGWGALRSVVQSWMNSNNAFNNIKALLKTNQHGGFDCPGCAWGDSPVHGVFKFCENGAKAVNWEGTTATVDAQFFANHSVRALSKQTDFWLESQGRLTHPMIYSEATDHYLPITWAEAFEVIATNLRNLNSPDEAEFYTSGRASNEAAFLYQLFVRAYGTNNFPDCSNLCHEPSGVALSASVGVGKGTVTLEDFEHADAIFVIGQNPGTNHPRMLEPLSAAVSRGAHVVCINPLKERGLERFQHPQHALEMLANGAHETNTSYIRPKLGGDFALFRGIAKHLLEWEREALMNDSKHVFDDEFIETHTKGIEDYLRAVDDTPWPLIIEQSGVSKNEIGMLACTYLMSNKVIMCWAMGITQHIHSVATITEITNVMLLRGNIGKAGAGLCPVRGHSNVQGDRTMGIHEAPHPAFLDAMEKRLRFKVSRYNGHNVVGALKAMLDGRSKVFIGLGGNFAQAAPDSAKAWEALRNCDLTVQISTKLNRSHLCHGRQALILPCLGRTDIDHQMSGEQCVTVEDSFSMVHASYGQLEPLSLLMRSEVAIISGIAQATLGSYPLKWGELVEDYDRIRSIISKIVPGFENYNEKIRSPGGFYLGNSAAERRWNTDSGRAEFISRPLPDSLIPKQARSGTSDYHLILQSIRSHDQYNTTIYGLNDRYRGVRGLRKVIFMNPTDIQGLGLHAGEKVDITSVWNDGVHRLVSGFTVVPYDILSGQAAAYYPEVNPLVPMSSIEPVSMTPAFKYIVVKVQRSAEEQRIF